MICDWHLAFNGTAEWRMRGTHLVGRGDVPLIITAATSKLLKASAKRGNVHGERWLMRQNSIGAAVRAGHSLGGRVHLHESDKEGRTMLVHDGEPQRSIWGNQLQMIHQ